MAARVDWLGLDDTSERISGTARAAGDDAGGITPQALQASPAVVLIADLDSATPLVSQVDDSHIRDDAGFVPISPSRPQASPAVVHIQPNASSFGLSDEVAFISGVYPDGTQPLYTFYAWNGDNPATYTGGFTNTRKWARPPPIPLVARSVIILGHPPIRR
jgi:hypothetical protein